jgi:chaperonin GroES
VRLNRPSRISFLADEYEHPELRNIASEIEELEDIGAMVVEDYETDVESRSGWMTKHASWIRLYFQEDYPLNPPWEGSSNESLPMLAEACNQYHARAMPAMFPSRDIIRAIPTGKIDEASKQRAERVSTHMSWQLMVKDKDYEKNKDRLLLSVPLHGSFFTKTYYDPVLKRNIVQNVRATDLVIPYGIGPRNIEDVERKTHVIPMSVNQSRILKEADFFLEECESYNDSTPNEADRTESEIQGTGASGRQDEYPCIVLEQHRFLDLDEDGIEEPYIVWVDLQSKQVLRITIRWDTDELGNPTDFKRPVECFTHYPFMENPDGFYGLGMGHLVGPLNVASNKLLRQTVDAATLANAGNASGFISQQLAVKGGDIRFQLGKFIKTTHGADDLSKGIWQFRFPGPSAVLQNIMQLLMHRSDRLATTTEALTGQTEKVMQPTTILALIEQGLQQFSAVYKRHLRSWNLELDKVFRLNRKYLDPEEYYAVLDASGVLQQSKVYRNDYEDDLQILPLADPKLTTEKQRLAKAEAEWGFLSQNPLVLNSPPHFYAASKRFLEALRSENTQEVLPNPNEGQAQRQDDPEMENAGAFLPIPQVPMAYPDQNHDQHIVAHTQALQTPQLGGAGRMALEEHIKSHERMSRMGGVNVTGMEGINGNAAVPPGTEGAFQPADQLEIGAMGESAPVTGAGGSNGMGGGGV